MSVWDSQIEDSERHVKDHVSIHILSCETSMDNVMPTSNAYQLSTCMLSPRADRLAFVCMIGLLPEIARAYLG